MEKSIFYEKLNKITGNVYTIEEEREVTDGIYEAELKHDNINQSTLNVYTGSKLTGTKITTYALSTPSLTPWKKIIKVFTNEPVIYISYETDGDTVEAEDINKVQESITLTQEAVTSEEERAVEAEQVLKKAIETETDRATKAEAVLTNHLQKEVERATKAEETLTKNLEAETDRATKAEELLTNHLQAEIQRATSAETRLTENLQIEVSRATTAEKELHKKLEAEEERATSIEEQLTSDLQTEITRARTAEQTIKEELTREESRAKTAEQTLTQNLVKEENRATAAEAALEVKKVDKIQGKGLSTNDLTNELKRQYDETYQNATSYTNQKIADLIGGAPETLDTLKEVADAIQEHKEITDALNSAIGTKANQTELDSHTRNNTIHITSTERTNWNDANSKKHTHTNKTVLDGITQALITAWNNAVTHISDTVKHITSTERTNWNSAKIKADSSVQTIMINGATQIKTNGVVNLPAYPSSVSGNAETATKLKTARKIGNASFDGSGDISLSQIGAAATTHTHTNYVNQNAFSNVMVGNTTIAADSTTDTFTLAAGSNITLTPDATNDKVTIHATNTVYTHPTTSGNKHIPTGGSSGQILKWSADGTATWQADTSLKRGGLTWNDLKGV